MAKFIRLPALFGEDYIVNAALIVEVTNLNPENIMRLIEAKRDSAFKDIKCQVTFETEHTSQKILTTKSLDQIEADLNR